MLCIALLFLALLDLLASNFPFSPACTHILCVLDIKVLLESCVCCNQWTRLALWTSVLLIYVSHLKLLLAERQMSFCQANALGFGGVWVLLVFIFGLDMIHD